MTSTSQAVYCLSLQIKVPNEDDPENTDKVMMTTTTTNSTSQLIQQQQQQQQHQQQHQQQQQQQQQHYSQQQPTTATINELSQFKFVTQSPHHHSGNIILVRGSRTENGQIILQNTQELLNLLGSENKDKPPMLINQQHIKTHENGKIIFHPASVKNGNVSAMDNSILLKSTINRNNTMDNNRKDTTTIINESSTSKLQQRIHLQTLKRLDKTQSFLLIRNTNSNSTTTSVNTKHSGDSSELKTTEEKVNKTDGTFIKQHQQFPLLGCDGEPIKLPDNLESLPRADHFPIQRHRWNTNEEIAAILISFDKHSEWQSKEVRTRPKSGSMLLYSRKKVRYRRDGYCWKKRKDGKTTREDHMKLKVQGTECIYGCYVHSAILPTFHRRCYWLLQNPDIVLVHYLNVPYPDDNKMIIAPSLALWGDKKEWTKEELVNQLKPMFFSEDDPDATKDIEISLMHSQTSETVEAIVGQLMEKQRLARQAALVKQLECGCPDSTCADGKSCSHPMRRVGGAKNTNETMKRTDNSNQVTSTTPSTLNCSKMYSRWSAERHQQTANDLKTQKSLDTSQFQVTAAPVQQPQRNTRVNKNHTTTDISMTPTHLNSNNNNNSNNGIMLQLNNNLNSPQLNINITEMAINDVNINNSKLQHHDLHQQIINNNNNNNCHKNVNHTNLSNNNKDQLTSATSAAAAAAVAVNSNQNITLSNLLSNNNPNNSNNNNNNNQQLYDDKHHQQQQQQQQQQQLQHQDQQILTNHHGLHKSTNNLSIQRPMSSNNNCNPNVNASNNKAIILPSMSLSQLQGTNNNNNLLIFDGQQQQQQQQQQQNQSITSDSQQLQKLDKDIHIKVELNSNSTHSRPSSMHGQHGNDNNNMAYLGGTQQIFQLIDTSESRNNSSDNNNNQKDMNHEHYSFFNATLDLSQEDIQQTLSANMPLGSNVQDDVIATGISTIDFIENCVSNGGHEDDAFVNLDAFDMLVEFPELELESGKNNFPHNNNNNNNNAVEHSLKNGIFYTQNTPIHNISSITDYSPEWAYPEGGVKVLITGPWTTYTSYSVLFDSFPVPTTLVQTGVLRCYCPQHEVGVAKLQVASDGYIISNSVNFEYKSPPNSEAKSQENSNEILYKFSLLNRLEKVDNELKIKSEPADQFEDTILFSQPNFEERLVHYCQNLIMKQWRTINPVSWTTGPKKMTLLHFAAILGYSKLVSLLLKWRSDNYSAILEYEIDGCTQDSNGCTPLMLACMKGHVDLSIMLYNWNRNALNVKNHNNRSAIEIALENGFNELANEINRLETNRNALKQASSDIMLANFSSFDDKKQELVTAVSDKNLYYYDENPRSHDGVFLRPGVVSNSPPIIRFPKRTSIDSGINIDIRNHRPGKFVKEQKMRIDRSMSLPISNSSHSNYSMDNFDNSLSHESPTTSYNSSTLNSNSLLSPLRKIDFALWESDVKVLTLAEQIIAAMPDRIKKESDETMSIGSSPLQESDSNGMSVLLNDTYIDSLPSSHFDQEFNFEFSDHNYRYDGNCTPCSSLSPSSSGTLQSPSSFSIQPDLTSICSPSPPPTTQDFTEFLQASNTTPRPFEADFSNLTLTDREQRELYEAAICIQKAYRSYKGRKKMEEQDKERSAAVVIQNYYRRYKQYAYYRQMTHAALVIQNSYRSYCENKRFKNSQTMSTNCSSHSVSRKLKLQNNYPYCNLQQPQNQSSKETSISGPLKRTYSQRTQNQAARKIQQFMRQSKNKLQKERAEKEKQVLQPKEYPISYHYHEQREEMFIRDLKLNNLDSDH